MPSPSTLARTVGAVAVASAAFGAVTPAHAASSYRYWGYYQMTDQGWSFATKGPAQTNPADGSVEGWRYAAGDGTSMRTPRAKVTFDAVCGSTAAASGKKRVAVVVDYGRTADARPGTSDVPKPVAKCALVDAKATGEQVLAAVAAPRVEKGMVCGIDSYPATGCSDTLTTLPAAAKAPDDQVTIAAPAASPSASASASAVAGKTDSDADTSTGKYIGGAAVIALLAAVAGMLLARRRKA